MARAVVAAALVVALGLLAPGVPESASDAQDPSAGPGQDPGDHRAFGLDSASHAPQPDEQRPRDAVPGDDLQHAVNYAFSQVLPDDGVAFALASAQSRPVDAGRQFEGDGFATWRDGDARFVSFTMTLSARGELVEFDYSAAPDAWGDPAPSLVAEN